MKFKAISDSYLVFFGRFQSREHGFMLVELIIVIMMIGILSGFAFVNFNSSVRKSRQIEAKLLVSAYMKAVQSYYEKYGSPPLNSSDLEDFVSVVACKDPSPIKCKKSSPVKPVKSLSWYSPSGNYQIEMRPLLRDNTHIWATPTQESGQTRAITGCYNINSKAVKVHVNLNNQHFLKFHSFC